MAIKTIVIAADGTRNLVDLHAEERLALSTRGKLILPPGLKRKENADGAILAEGEVLLVDADGATYTVFLQEGSAIEVAQATQTEFPTNPASAEPSLGTIPVNPNPNLPTNPNPNLGGAYGGAGGGASGAGVGYAITTAGILGGIGIVALAADSSDDDDDNDGGNENPTGNLPPTIVSNGGNATAFVPVLENSAAVTTVVAADPNLGDAITFSLAGGADQALFSIDPTSGALRFLTAPDFEAPSDANKDGTYEVVVQASDGVLIDTQALSVAVTDVDETEPNQAPVITTNGGLAISASTPENAVFSTKIEATDADGDAITFSLVDVLDRQYFSISQGGTLTLTAQDFENKLDSDQNGIYSVQVSASDGDATDFITVNVTVTDINEGTPGGAAPVLAGGDTAALSVAENVTAVGTVVATDADVADVVTYSLGGGADAALFVIDASTGALAFKAGQNFEAPADADGDNSYVVVVKASDGTLSDTQTITVTVTDANDAPSITSNGGGDTAAISIEENTAAVTTVVATDVDAGDTLSYSISGGADAALFTIDAKTGALSFQNAPDSEAPADKGANNVYDVIVTASDGDASDSQAIAVSVTSTDETNTVIGGQLDGEVIEAGSSDPGTPIVSGQLTATDPDGPANSFKVSSGTATYGTFDVTEDGKWTYSLNNANTDVDALNDGGTLTDSFDVTSADGSVATIDITINGTTDVVPNQPNNTSIGGTLTGVVEEAGSANAGGKQTTTGQLTAFDPDGPDNTFASVAGATTYGSYSVNAVGLWTYSLTNSLAAVNGLQGGEILPDSFIVTALDGSTNTVNVTIQGANDNPVTDAAQAVVTGEDTPLQVTVTATDVDGDTLSFSSPAASTNGGQVSGGAGGVFTYTPGQNFSGKDSFVVTVNDGNGGMAQQTITVTVSALQDDAPVITSDGGGDEGTVEVIENTTAVTTVTSKDADLGDAATYSITGGDHATFFKIDETTGALQFFAPPSAEQGQGAGLLGNAYEVIVAATDGKGLSDSQTLTVIVKNDGLGSEIGEFPPQIISNGGTDEAQISIDENTTFVTEVDAKESGLDLDGKADTFLYRIAGGDDAEAFTINQSTGVLSFIDAPDFENDLSQGGNNEFKVIVQVSDDDGVDYQSLTVVVKDVDTIFTIDDVNTALEQGGVDNNMPIVLDKVTGNVLDNDIDERGAQIELFVIEAAKDGALEVEVNDTDTLIDGEYGDLLLRSDGTYSYIVDQTDAEVQALNVGDELTDTFLYTVTNSKAVDAVTVDASLVITINGANDAPSVDLNGAEINGINFTTSFKEGTTAGVLLTAASVDVSDPDNALQSAIITLRAPGDALPNADTESLSVLASAATAAGITQIYDKGTGTLLLTGLDASPDDFESVLATLRYKNSGDLFDPESPRTVTVVVNDGDLDSPAAVTTITLVDVADAPIANADTNLTTKDAVTESGVNPGNTAFAGDPSAVGNVLLNDIDPDSGDNTDLSVFSFGVGATAGVVGGSALAGTYGDLAIAANGSYTYTLDNSRSATQGLTQGQIVTDEFDYVIKDASGLTSNTSTLTLTVTGTNDAPVADSESRNTTEDTATVTAATGIATVNNVLNGDTDPDAGEAATLLVGQVNGDTANVGKATDGIYGTLVLNADGSYVYTLGAKAQELGQGDVQSDVFTYAATDVNGATSANATLTFNITGSNDAPVAVNDTNAADAVVEQGVVVGDATAAGNVLANDKDVDSGGITGASVTSIAFGAITGTLGASLDGLYGSLVLNVNGGYIYTLDNNKLDTNALTQGQAVAETFTYTIKDASGLAAAAPATLIISITGTNDAPVADGENRSITEGGAALTAAALPDMNNVLNGDTDVDTGETATLIVSKVDGFAGNVGVAVVGDYGTLTLNVDGSYSYTLDATSDALDIGEKQDDVFAYTVQDAKGGTDTATLTITVTGISDPTTLPADTTITIDENTTAVTTVVGTDADGAPLEYSITGGTDKTFFVIDKDTGVLSLVAGKFVNMVGPDFENPQDGGINNTYVVIVNATDLTDNTSDTQTITVKVQDVNEAPTITPLADIAATEDTLFFYALPALSFNDQDKGDVITVTAAQPNGTALPSWLNYSAVTKEFVGTPSQSDAGVVTVRVTATDKGGLSTFDDFTITVEAVNDAPTITAPAKFAVLEDVSTKLTGISFADVDSGVDDVMVTLEVTGAGMVTGAASTADVTVTNGWGASVGLEGSISDINAFIAAGNVTFLTSSNSVTDVVLTVSIDDQGENGSGGAKIVTQPVTLQVTAVNDAPEGPLSINVPLVEDTTYVFMAGDFTAFSDPNDTPANALSGLTVTTLPTNGMLSLFGVLAPITAGQFIPVAQFADLRFTPTANFVGTASFTFQYRDNGGTANGGIDTDQTASTFNFMVSSVDDAPQGTNGTVTAIEDVELELLLANFGFNDSLDNPNPNAFQSVFISTIPINGELRYFGAPIVAGTTVTALDIGSGGLTFVTENVNDNGAAYASFEFQVIDNGAGANKDLTPNTLTIDVAPAQDSPVAADDVWVVTDNTVVTAPWAWALGNDSDVDGDALSVANALITSNLQALNNNTANKTFELTASTGVIAAEFQYNVTDGIAQDSATVQIGVTDRTDGDDVIVIPVAVAATYKFAYLDGGLGNDNITGGDGVDYLFTGGGGIDSLSGGKGDDVLIANEDGGGSILDGGEGNDTLVALVGVSGGAAMRGGAGNDVIIARNDVLMDITFVQGQGGNDLIDVTEGAAQIQYKDTATDSGQDTIIGFSGAGPTGDQIDLDALFDLAMVPTIDRGFGAGYTLVTVGPSGLSTVYELWLDADNSNATSGAGPAGGFEYLLATITASALNSATNDDIVVGSM